MTTTTAAATSREKTTNLTNGLLATSKVLLWEADIQVKLKVGSIYPTIHPPPPITTTTTTIGYVQCRYSRFNGYEAALNICMYVYRYAPTPVYSGMEIWDLQNFAFTLGER